MCLDIGCSFYPATHFRNNLYTIFTLHGGSIRKSIDPLTSVFYASFFIRCKVVNFEDRLYQIDSMVLSRMMSE